jgi:4-amino-4-deoxy-L-arabinose transferase-like glycosyltransferase
MVAKTIFNLDERLQSPAAWRRTLFVIFSVALLIRIGFIFTMNGEFPEKFDRAPLYPLFLAGIYGLAGEGIIFPRIIQAFLGACIAVLIAVIGRRSGGPGVGAIAGMLWGVYPMGVFIAGLTYPTTLLTLLLACGVLCLVSNPGHRGYPARVALAGLLFGLAALAKPIVLGTVVFVALWMIVWLRSGRTLLVSIFILTIVASLVPWTVRNAYVHDKLVPIEARGLNDVTQWSRRPADTRESENKTLRYITRIVRHYPRELISFFELYPRRVHFLEQPKRDKFHEQNPRFVRKFNYGTDLITVVSILSVGPIFAFALIGAWAMWREKARRREFSLFILMVMSFALGYAVTFGKIRYRIPVDPYIIIMSSFGVMYLINGFIKRRTAPG